MTEKLGAPCVGGHGIISEFDGRCADDAAAAAVVVEKEEEEGLRGKKKRWETVVYCGLDHHLYQVNVRTGAIEDHTQRFQVGR